MSRLLTVLKAAAPLALLAVSACATPGFKADVKRFQAMPAPQGQSFAVVAANPKLESSLEFAQYAGLVTDKMKALGYQPATSSDTANLLVKFDYGVDDGKDRTRVGTGSRIGFGFGYGGWGHPGFGYYPGYWGRHSRRTGYYMGWYDPWAFGGFGDELEQYTVYTSKISLQIDRKDSPVRAFEGSAQALSTTDNLTKLVPNLVEAMFTGFPGNNGETVKITVAPPPREKINK